MAVSERQRRWRRIARLYANGRTRSEIGARLGLDPGRVGAEIAKMRAAGWDLPYRPTTTAATVAERERTVLDMWPTGASYRKLAGELDMTVDAVAGLVARMRAGGAHLPRRRPRTRLESPGRDRMLELWADGHSYDEISQLTDTTAAAVSSALAWARRLGHQADRRVDQRQLAEQRDRIADLYRDAVPLADIAADVGTSVGAVSMTIARMRDSGVDLPRRLIHGSGDLAPGGGFRPRAPSLGRRLPDRARPRAPHT